MNGRTGFLSIEQGEHCEFICPLPAPDGCTHPGTMHREDPDPVTLFLPPLFPGVRNRGISSLWQGQIPPPGQSLGPVMERSGNLSAENKGRYTLR